MPEKWADLFESLSERNFQCDCMPHDGAGGVETYAVSDSLTTLELTTDEILQLVVHPNPHKQFAEWFQKRQQEAI